MQKKILKKINNFFSLPPPISKKALLSFNNSKLVVADVGSAGGLSNRWNCVKEKALFLTFDPQPEEEIIEDSSKKKFFAKHDPFQLSSEKTSQKTSLFKNFECGLWSSVDKKSLAVTIYPAASSLFEHNHPFLDSFLNAPCHEVIRQETIIVNTMENLVGQLKPDFIKIDAEGAEIEILEGCKKFIDENTLGLELEVSFQERHKNAPFFSDIDSYLRKQGYQLMSLSREHWIRKNDRFFLYSCPQLIWGNAVYMLKSEVFFKRGGDLEKFVLLLLIYRFHDYAYEIIQKAKEKGIKDTDRLFKLVDSSINRKTFHFLWFIRILSGLVLASFITPFLFPFPQLKVKGKSFIKKQLRHLGFLLCNIQRIGPYQGVIADFEF